MSLLSRSEYNSNILTFIPDNTNRLISEEDVRDRFVEAKDSFLSMVSGFDLSEYSNVTAYQIGDCVIYEDLLYRKINNPNTGVDPTDVMEWELLPSTPFSDESKFGIVKKATFIEFTGGTNDSKFVTPFQIASLNIPESLGDLTDVDFSTPPTEGQTLVYDSINSVFYPDDAISINPLSLAYLSFNPATRVLTFNDSSLVENLDDLVDVVATSPSIGQTIFWNGINYTLDYPVNIDSGSTLFLSFDNTGNTLSFDETNVVRDERFEFFPDLETAKQVEYCGIFEFVELCYDITVFDSVSFEAGRNLDYPSAFTPIADLTALNTWINSTVGAGEYWQLRVLVEFDSLWESKGYVTLKRRKDECA